VGGLIVLSAVNFMEAIIMWNHKYAEINDLRIHYVEQGQGKVILFLHGFPEFWYAWKDQLLEFSKDFRAVAMDMRGYNLSSKPEALEQYQIQYLIDDVKEMVKALGAEKIHLVAHDWGGAIAWAFALAYPELLEKLVIINAPHPAVFWREIASNPEQREASSYMLMFRDPQAEKLLSANNYSWLRMAVFDLASKANAYTDEDRKMYMEAWAQPGALTGGLNYYRANIPPFSMETGATDAPATPLFELAKAQVKVPTLVIWGEQDMALLTGNLDGLEQFVPDLRVNRIPSATHWVVHEEPELVNATIREFLSDIRP
jgi:pimeloyl-ACP methyl ester carboxylesterase